MLTDQVIRYNLGVVRPSIDQFVSVWWFIISSFSSATNQSIMGYIITVMIKLQS